MSKNYLFLALETSCDDTCASVCCGKDILSNIVHKQSRHADYGGVVPEFASREHSKMIANVAEAAIRSANISLNELDAIACTKEPGLLGSLIVGRSFAKGLALSINKPLVWVNHLHAHALSPFIGLDKDEIFLPTICLLVSGGHTQLIYIDNSVNIKILGETTDDAVGEAFDKIGKRLGLLYPAGPKIDILARSGDSSTFSFPNTRMNDYNFSFSGIKNYFNLFIEKGVNEDSMFVEKNLSNICASIQYKLIDMLVKKTSKALDDIKPVSISIAGGVAANSGLRNQILALAKEKSVKSYLPKIEYCTDNAAMIGFAASYKSIS